VIVDRESGSDVPVSKTWHPAHEPSDVELIASAFVDAVSRPSQIVDNVRGAITDVKAVGRPVFSAVGALVSTVARTAVRPAPVSPLNAEIGEARRYVIVGTDLADFRTVRNRLALGHYADEVTINDVVLATISGALRSWLLTRGEGVQTATTVRAMVPISVYDTDEADPDAHERPGDKVIACFVDLPVGEPAASMRLHQIAFSMRQQIEGGHAVGADSLADLAGFASPTLHSLGVRLGSAMSRRVFNLIITNVPGPQQPLYVGNARMLSAYPVVPLARGQAVSIGLTSYDGGVYFGLNGDRDAMPDLDLLGQCLVDSLADLVEIRDARG
jgi:WS/DGAT/MGAT family acyltransferase